MKNYYYGLLFLMAVFCIWFVPLYIPYGGVTSDSVHYFRLAEQIPHVTWSVFPLGYPLLLKFFHLFNGDWFWTGKLSGIIIYIVIAAFSYLKKFHFRETIILLMTKIFFYSFFNIISEGLFLALMYFLFYYLYQFFEGNRKGVHFYIPAAILVAIMFSVRYSAVYLLVGMGLFYLWWFVKRRKEINFFRNDYFLFLLYSAVGIGVYMIFNYLNFGDFAGEKYRAKPYMTGIGEDFFRNVVSVFNSFNPVLGIKLQGHSPMVFAVESVLMVINLIFIYFSVKIWRQYFRKNEGSFHQLLIVMGLVYTFFLFITIFFQGIEELNIRLLAESSICYFFSLIFLCFKEKRYEKPLFWLAAFSLIFNSLYVLKVPENYLKKKNEIEKIYSTMKGKKYYFIDDKDHVRIETYRIPIINKEVKYEHQNMNEAMVNGSIMMTKDPKVFWILKDTVKQKREVVYSSQLRQK